MLKLSINVIESVCATLSITNFWFESISRAIVCEHLKKKEIIYKRNRFFLNNYTIQINTLVKHQLLKLRTISLNLTKLVYIQELK